MRKQENRFLVSAFLVLCLLISCLPVAQAAPASQNLALQEIPATSAGLAMNQVEEPELDTPQENERLRVIILFQEKPLVEAGFSTMGIGQNRQATAYRAKLIDQQDLAMEQVESALRQDLDVRYQFTIGVNGVATTVSYNQIPAIEALDCVKSVYIENQYLPDTDEVNTSTAGEMVGSYHAWADGYTGAGSRIAIIDTGLDLDHPSFDESAYLYGLELSAAKFGKEISDYNLLTKEEVAKVLPSLHASTLLPGLSAGELYRNAKVPYAFNYIDQGLDVTHDADSQGDHGTHVSGIATANTYVWAKDADGDRIPARQENGVVGIAPDAQILPMKVFGKAGGAYDDDYMAAIEDAILLDCDSVNLSLGSSNVGHTYGDYDELFASLTNQDTVVTISAGNKYSYAEFSLESDMKLLRTEDTVLNTVGSPGSFGNAFTIASVDNAGLTGIMPSFNGVYAPYSDTYANYNMRSFVSLDTSDDASGVEYPYVFLGDPTQGMGIYGAEEDFAGLDLTGKIALISRGGGVSFFEKCNRAVEAGAVATVVYNNVDGSINMNMTGYNYKNPAVTITLLDAMTILDKTERQESGLYVGTMRIANRVSTIHDVAGGYIPSNFSSWGVPGNLDLKPEIIAPGGNIWSTLTDGSYGSMSGTSMSAPSVTGMAAVVAQYVKENKLAEQEQLTVRALTQALLMSTANPLMENDTIEYSPRKQGAGLANVYAAVTSPAYLLTDGKDATDGKVKACLGDDVAQTGEYEFDFTINNMSEEALRYQLRAAVHTMAVETVDGKDYMSNTAYALRPVVRFETEEDSEYLYDVNGDGVIDAKDAKLLLKIANGTAAPLPAEETAKYDFNEDGEITTKDAQIYLAALRKLNGFDVFTQAVSVKAGGSTEIHATIQLSEEDKAYFAENYQNGCYVEGYVYASDPCGIQAELSLPFLAYYGAWTDASMFDPYITLEDSGNPDAYTYVGNGYANALTIRSGSSAYYLTSNPYASGIPYLEDRTAISSISGDSLNTAMATLIRNAGGAFYAEISNAETGEIYKTTNPTAQLSAFYNTTSSAWAGTSTSANLSWACTDANGQKLPEGTKIQVSVYAIPEYNWDRSTGKVIGQLGEGASWVTTMTVDNTAPVVQGASITRDLVTGKATLHVTAQDNRYVAAVLLQNARQTEILTRQGVDQREPGIPVSVDVDTTEIKNNEVVMLVLDYAGNASAYQINLGGAGDEEPVSDTAIYANNTLDRAWIAFDPGKMSTAKTICDGYIYAAEYIDGYVFTVDTDKRFCVAPLGSLENQTYIETLNLPSNALDMAYNYADGKLYILCSENRLFTVDPLMGQLSIVGTVPLKTGISLMTLACSTEGTFYGATYSDYDSRLYSFTISAEGFDLKAAPKTTGMAVQFIQSMAYDHNTGKLYHANYGYKNYYTTLVTYDLETGEATIVDEMFMAELAGMFIPRKSTSIFGPSKDVQEISLSQHAVSMIKGGTMTLEVSAKPWTVVNRNCTWTSSDESVATVRDGVISAIGAGTATITATSVLNPSVSDTCTVTVSAVETDLTGVVWDAEGEVWFSQINTAKVPAYTKLTTTAWEPKVMAMTTTPSGTTYAATYEENNEGALVSSLYTVSAKHELTKIGTAQIGYTDLTTCPSLNGGTVLATYGNYVAVVNTDSGDMKGYWDLSGYIGDGSMVGICYYQTQKDDTLGSVDYCLMLDSTGKVWLCGFCMQNDAFKFTTPEVVAELNCSTNDSWYFSSIATDGKYLYSSIFSGNQTDLVLLDLSSGSSANVGNFGPECWPVAGLQIASSGKTATSALLRNAMEASAMTAPVSMQTESVPSVIR